MSDPFDLARDIPPFLDRRPKPVAKSRIPAPPADLFEQAVEQPRSRDPERRDVYEAVLTLRHAGHRVLRCGRDCHLVDGERLVTPALLFLAARAA